MDKDQTYIVMEGARSAGGEVSRSLVGQRVTLVTSEPDSDGDVCVRTEGLDA